MNDKIILVTGATSGIGKAAALALANEGATLIIHGRNRAKATAVKNELINDTGNLKIEIVIADLFSQPEIKRMAGKISEKFERLDVVINNAGGMMAKERGTTPDGKEKTVAINLLAPYLLSALLLDKLKQSTNGRIINVSSSAHKTAKPDFEDIEMKKDYTPLKAYGNTKLFQILMTRHFAKRTKGARSR